MPNHEIDFEIVNGNLKKDFYVKGNQEKVVIGFCSLYLQSWKLYSVERKRCAVVQFVTFWIFNLNLYK